MLSIPRAKLDQLMREYVSGGGINALSKLQEALPQYIDDVTRDFGADLYERMMTDPDCDSAISILIDSVLADGAQILPAAELPKSGQFTREEAIDANHAAEYAAFIGRVLDDFMQPGLYDLSAELLEGVAIGSKVAEKVVEYIPSGEDKGRLGYRTIRCKPRNTYAWVTDAWRNVVGFLVQEPGLVSLAIASLTSLQDVTVMPNYLPADKFVRFQWNCANGDPRGRSLLRSSYNSWFIKTQILPEYYLYLRRFGTPTVLGKTPENGAREVEQLDAAGNPVIDTDGSTKMMTAQEAMKAQLMNIGNGTVFVVPSGAEVSLVFSQGDGNAFLFALDYFGRQIHTGVLRTSRASKEAQHGSKADTSTAQDLTSALVLRVKKVLEATIQRDIIRPLMVMNFGDASLKLEPKISLAKSEKRDRAAWLQVCTAAWVAKLVQPEQLNDIFADVGLPTIDLQTLMTKLQEQEDMQRQQIGLMSTLMHPAKDPNAKGGNDSESPVTD